MLMFESSVNQQSKKAFFGIIFNELTEVCLFLSVLQTKKVDHNFALYMSGAPNEHIVKNHLT